MSSSPALLLVLGLGAILASLVFSTLVLVYLLTFIGPLYHVIYAIPREKAILEAFAKGELVGLGGSNDVGFYQSRKFGMRVFYRWTHSPASKHSIPCVLPAGLGATVINTCFLHDGLVDRGFNVLSYDRPGVGLSGPGRLSPAQHVDLMAELMNHVAVGANWGLFAGSFGNTVAQLFVARHPSMVCCVLNLDGLPYILGTHSDVCKAFERVELIYKFEVIMSKLGILRPFLAMATRKLPSTVFARVRIPWPVILAHLQSARLLEAIRDEVMLMMEFGRDVAKEWGPLSLDRLPLITVTQLETLAGSEVVPGGLESGSFALERERLKSELRNLDDGGLPLPRQWRTLAVCSISCRDYSYDRMELFMTPKIKSMYASEHNFLALLARSGRRIEYLNESHATGPFLGAPHYDAMEQLVAVVKENSMVDDDAEDIDLRE